ncbi:hypothetical protein GF351_06465 [Candidatus Woesearchaeota archaeon]|nr:hypothetical protein [Candidatus Woesearchaeota archaeon]
MNLEQRTEVIKDAIQRGIDDPNDIGELLGLKASTIVRICRHESIDTPFKPDPLIYVETKNDPEKDRLISQFRSLPEMARRLGTTRQNIHQYLWSSGQHAVWKAGRAQSKSAEKSQKEEMYSRLAAGIRAFGTIIASPRSLFIYNHALNVFSNAPKTRLSLHEVWELLGAYHDAGQHGQKLSYSQLGDVVGISTMGARNIIRAAELSSMYYNTRLHRTSGMQIQAMDRAYLLPLSTADTAHFVGVHPQVVYRHFSKNQEKRPEREFLGSILSISFKKASMVYEAYDAGFSRQDICEYSGATSRQVRYVMNKRGSIQPRIISVLQDLFEQPVEQPYSPFF